MNIKYKEIRLKLQLNMMHTHYSNGGMMETLWLTQVSQMD